MLPAFLFIILFLSAPVSSSTIFEDSSSSSEDSESRKVRRVPSLQTMVMESHPWETLDWRSPISCRSRVQAIGVLGLILFKYRNTSRRLLANALDQAMSRENVAFNALMEEAFLEFTLDRQGNDPKGGYHYLEKSVYGALTEKKSGGVKCLLYQLLSRTKPPISLSLQLSLKIALMRTIGKDVQAVIHNGRPPLRQNNMLTMERISQVLLVPELEAYIGEANVEHFFQIAGLTSFEYLYAQFGFVSDRVAKILLKSVRPRLTHAHLQFQSNVPFLSAQKQRMLKKYQARGADRPSGRLMMLGERQDRRKALLDSLLINVCLHVELTPIHITSSPILQLAQVTIDETGLLTMHLLKRRNPTSVLYFKSREKKFVRLTGKWDREVRVRDRDVLILCMQQKINGEVLTVLRRMFKERGCRDPLFLYFVRKYDLTVFLIQAPHLPDESFDEVPPINYY